MNLLTLDETAVRFHVSVATMRSSAFRAKLVAAGLRTLRVGRRVLVRHDSIPACLDHLRAHPQWGPGKVVRQLRGKEYNHV